MREAILRAGKTYLVITLVMVINALLTIAILWLLVERTPEITSWDDVRGLQVANGDPETIQMNLSTLDMLYQKGMHPNLGVILKYCGEPARYVGDIDSDLTLIYIYSRFARKDAATYVSLKSGFLVGIAYSDSSVFDDSSFKKWDIPDNDIPLYQ